MNNMRGYWNERIRPLHSNAPFLDPLYESKLHLPDFAQHTPVADIFVQPDFYYQRGTVSGICIFIDGPYPPPLAEKRICEGEKRLKIEDIE
jgi:hypothetical protein